jgi:hypothetical protein
MNIRDPKSNVVPFRGRHLMALALAGAATTSRHNAAGTLAFGELDQYTVKGSDGKQYLDIAGLQSAGLSFGDIASGVNLAGKAFRKQPWDAGIDALRNELHQNVKAMTDDYNSKHNDVMNAIKSLQVPSAQHLTEHAVNRRRAEMVAKHTPILSGQEPDERQLQQFNAGGQFSPAGGGVAGQTSFVGAPQVWFTPNRMVIAGSQTAYTANGFGTLGIVITAVYVGNKLQSANVPGGTQGTPVEYYSAQMFDGNFVWNTAGPAISITIAIAWPGSFAAGTSPFNAVVAGPTAYS